MIKWSIAISVALVLGVIISVLAFVGSRGSFLWALRGFGLGVCIALGLAVIDAVLTRCCDCQEGNPF